MKELVMKNSQKWISLAIRYILGVIFIYSAYTKLQDPLGFAESIQNYRVFGLILSNWSAVLVPVLEGILGILLISGLFLEESLLLTLSLYLIFDVMIVQALFRGLDISCGCFSPTDGGPVDATKILQNLFLTALVVLGYYLNKANLGTEK
jgi:uncharacterized membrane protein YphA (DoxX/SURF4 family)